MPREAPAEFRIHKPNFQEDACMASPNQINVSQLQRLIGTTQCPIIVDVRIDEDFAQHPLLIPTAQRCQYQKIEQMAQQVAGTSVVVYCHKGLKLSEGAAAILRSLGVQAEVLKGGMLAWVEAGAPCIESAKLPLATARGNTLWVTKARPKIDRIACPWLIKRFIDPNAQFLFVPASQVSAVAEKFHAIPFDIPDTSYSHRNELCTFDVLLDEFKLESPALRHLARIIRGADTNALELTAQSSGLLAIALGFSRIYKDDLEQLEHSLCIYDALYRWCRDAVDEQHQSLNTQ